MKIREAKMRIDSDRIRRIEETYSSISSSPNYHLIAQKMMDRHLRYLSDIHSFWLEHPEEKERILNLSGYEGSLEDQNRIRKILKEISKKGLERLEEAWRYLTRVKGDRVLIPEDILKVLRYVEPSVNDANSRDVRVSLNLDRFTPPNYVRVEGYLSQACDNLRDGKRHPVESSALAHLLIAGIQPGRDGNKRTARLIQNRILRNAKLPPAIIRLKRREEYLSCLEEGLVGVREGEEERISVFGNFIAARVQGALDAVVHKIKGEKAEIE